MTVNQQVLEGNWNEIKGELRKRWGRLSGDELEAAHGSVDKLIGTIQRQTGEAREQVERYLEELTSNGASMVSKTAESIRDYARAGQESVHQAAQQLSESAKAGYAATQQTVQERPFESLAVCFGAGLLSGVLVGLLLRSR